MPYARVLPVWIILLLYRFCIIGYNLTLKVKPFTNLIRFYLSTVEISKSTQCTSALDACAAFVFHCDQYFVCHQRHSLLTECAIQKRKCGAKYPFWLPPFTRGKNLHLRTHNSFLVCAPSSVFCSVPLSTFAARTGWQIVATTRSFLPFCHLPYISELPRRRLLKHSPAAHSINAITRLKKQ